MFRRRLLILATLLALAGCSAPQPEPPTTEPPETTASPALPPTPTITAEPSPTMPSPSPSPSMAEARAFDAEAATSAIETLAGLGPREATSDAFAEAAEFVTRQFAAHGYEVWTQEFEVPAGDSWGIEVPAGTSHNVIADPPGFDASLPHVVIGAHLDTVPQSPGAEDNASGVAVTLELARMVAEQPAALPVRFIAFGAEEPRGQGDDLHHFGSTFHANSEEAGEIRAMVSLDRVGVPAEAVPIAFGGSGSPEIRDALEASAPVQVAPEENRTSDHWSYEKAGIPAARLGSVSFSGYHSPGDVPSVIDPAQLERTSEVVWAWLVGLEA